MTLILYNPHANNNDVTAALDGAMAYASAPDTVVKDLTTVDVRAEICALSENDRVLLCGGDGTLMRVANALDGAAYTAQIYLWKSGTGNDFLRDLGKNEETEPVLLNPYLLVPSRPRRPGRAAQPLWRRLQRSRMQGHRRIPPETL